MTYETVVQVSYLTTLLLFGLIFAGVVVYAYWPGNKEKFQHAARVPLEKGDDMSSGGHP